MAMVKYEQQYKWVTGYTSTSARGEIVPHVFNGGDYLNQQMQAQYEDMQKNSNTCPLNKKLLLLETDKPFQPSLII